MHQTHPYKFLIDIDGGSAQLSPGSTASFIVNVYDRLEFVVWAVNNHNVSSDPVTIEIYGEEMREYCK